VVRKKRWKRKKPLTIVRENPPRVARKPPMEEETPYIWVCLLS